MRLEFTTTLMKETSGGKAVAFRACYSTAKEMTSVRVQITTSGSCHFIVRSAWRRKKGEGLLTYLNVQVLAL